MKILIGLLVLLSACKTQVWSCVEKNSTSADRLEFGLFVDSQKKVSMEGATNGSFFKMIVEEKSYGWAARVPENTIEVLDANSVYVKVPETFSKGSVVDTFLGRTYIDSANTSVPLECRALYSSSEQKLFSVVAPKL